MGVAIKHPAPDRVKPSFVIFDIRALTLSTHIATVGIEGLKDHRHNWKQRGRGRVSPLGAEGVEIEQGRSLLKQHGTQSAGLISCPSRRTLTLPSLRTDGCDDIRCSLVLIVRTVRILHRVTISFTSADSKIVCLDGALQIVVFIRATLCERGSLQEQRVRSSVRLSHAVLYQNEEFFFLS